jgi:hypothetical protein
MQELTDPAGIAALAAGGLALIALLTAGVLAIRVRRLRAAQRVVLGGEGRDLAGHAAELQFAFTTLNGRVEEVAEHLEARMGWVEQRLDGAIAHRGLVRYDAYGELSGQQSFSLALLDATRTGLVLSCITNRDTMRLYCAEVHGGQGARELSPEEAEALRTALAGQPGGVPAR